MSLRTLILLSPFVLAVILGRAVRLPEEPRAQDTGPMYNFSMKRYQWNERPLLVFSPSRDDRAYCETMIVWNRNGPKLDEYDLALIEVFEDGVSRAEGREIPQESATHLRELFQVEDGDLTILLVGKDGSEKGRWNHLPRLQDIYDLIDPMPMRQREIRSQQQAHPE